MEQISVAVSQCQTCGKTFTPHPVSVRRAIRLGIAPPKYCSRACLARSPEVRAKYSATRAKMVEAGTWNGGHPDSEAIRIVREGLNCSHCGNLFYPLKQVAHEYVRRKYAVMCSRECDHANRKGIPRPPGSGLDKTEHHVKANFYCVKSPDNVQFVFRNAENFVREHPDLFSEEQRRLRGKNIIAAHGLRSLFCEWRNRGKKQQAESWRGWTGVWKKDRLGKVVWARYPIK